MYELNAQTYSAHVFFMCSPHRHSVYDVNIISVQMRMAFTWQSGALQFIDCDAITHTHLCIQTWVSRVNDHCVSTVCVTISLILLFRCCFCCCCFSAGEISIEGIYHRLLMCPKITVPFFWSTILSTSASFLLCFMHFSRLKIYTSLNKYDNIVQ